jgi:hypothetical protein
MKVKFARTSLMTALLLGLSACASSGAPVEAGPWGGINPGDAYYLGEGSAVTIDESGGHHVRIQVREGHLWLNDEDLGEYTGDEPVRFLRDGRLVVGETTRAQLGSQADSR